MPAAYDDATGQFLAYDSGIGVCTANSPMWSWDGAEWSHLATPGPGQALTDPVIAYDQDSRQLLAFGGYESPCAGRPAHLAAGTWSWNGVAWQQLHPPASPPAGSEGCAAYDPLLRQVVMYGLGVSFDPSPSGDDRTWTWNGSTWTPHSTTTSPPTPALGCGMAFDPDTGTVLLVEIAPNNPDVETWAWDGDAWAQKSTTGPQAIYGVSSTLAVDPVSGQVLLYVGLEPCPRISGFGGGDCLSPVSQMWQWQNGTWSELSAAVAPPSRVDGVFGFDAGTGQLVLSGGDNQGSWQGDTWVSAPQGGSSAQVRRVAGTDRDETAVQVSSAAFPTANSAASVVLARDDEFADALVGAPLAAAKNGPLLLSSSSDLPSVTRDELTRVLTPHGTVYLLGGATALSGNVATQVAALGYTVVRLSGADRYATAAAVANALGNPSTVFEASGLGFADALSAAPAAASQRGAVLLTAGDAQAGATAAYLSAHATVRYAVGGAAADADPGATAIVGADRYGTAAAIARAFFPRATSFAVATGQDFPDALAGGAYSGLRSQPLLLVPSTGNLPASVSAYVSTHAYAVSAVDVLGGPAAVDDSVLGLLANALAG